MTNEDSLFFCSLIFLIQKRQVSLFHFGDFKAIFVPLVPSSYFRHNKTWWEMNSEFGALQLRFSGTSEWTSSIIGVSWFLVIKIRSPHSRLCLLGELKDRDGGRVSKPAVQETRSQKWQEGGHSCKMQSKKTDGRSGFGSTSLLRRLAAEHEPLSIVSGTRGASPVASLQRRCRVTADLQAASLMKPQPWMLDKKRKEKSIQCQILSTSVLCVWRDN